MALSLKDKETDRLAREVAALTGETLTYAIRKALAERLERERLRRGKTVRLADRLMQLGRECAALPDYDKLRAAKPDALIMHPGPMNRGVEIGSEIADDIDRSLIRSQVEMGVAVRMACLEILTRDLGNGPPLP